MTEQTSANQTTTKVERSAVNQSCRLSYDCLIASSKTFLHHFNLLSDEERLEYKSLGNHVKQLNKCNEVIKKNSSVSKRSTLKVVTEPVAVAEPATESVVEPVVALESTGKGKKKATKAVKDEHSPTAQVVASAVSEQKKGRGKKVTEPVVEQAAEPVVEQVAEPVTEPVKKSAAKKTATKSK
jgi:hypothetical protein